MLEKSLCGFAVGLRRGAIVVIKGDAKGGKAIPNDGMVTVHNVLRGHSLCTRFHNDRNAHFIASTNENHVLALQPEITRVEVRR